MERSSTETAAGLVPRVLVAPEMIVIELVASARADRGRRADRVRARLAREAPGIPVTLSITGVVIEPSGFRQ